jgi:MscS family membrane protein
VVPQLIPPPLARFATPRETLKTLYFSVFAYDFRPALIDDAIDCLEFGSDKESSSANAARLAIELDAVLRTLCVAVHSVPDLAAHESLVIQDEGPFKIAMHRQADGRWRFDRDTVVRIPGMYRAALVRFRDQQGQPGRMSDGFTDPATTMRKFVTNVMRADYYSAARALDLSALPTDQRSDRGPVLAQQLGFVLQRRGWVFLQEIPNSPDGMAYTWHADKVGRIVLDSVVQADGKYAWLFTRRTVAGIEQMYQAVLKDQANPRYLLLNGVVPPIDPDMAANGNKPPATVPAVLGSPRSMLKGFFRAIDESEVHPKKLQDALPFLDLRTISAADRPALGGKLAVKLEAVLRKLRIDLASISEAWNAPAQVLGAAPGPRVEIVRQRDGCWRFSRTTIEQIPQLFDKLAAQDRSERERAGQRESARDTMTTFLKAGNHQNEERAGSCLDLSRIPETARDDVGPVLAFKLRYVLNRIGRVYPQEIPDDLEGPRYIFHNGEYGQIVIARKTSGPDKGKWLFTAGTVRQIENMFRIAWGRPIDASLAQEAYADQLPSLRELPGLWLRFHLPTPLPAWAKMTVRGLELYQAAGLVLTFVLSWLVARLGLTLIQVLTVWLLRRSGSVLTSPFVAGKLRPLTWVCGAWLFFHGLDGLDLPAVWLGALWPVKTILMAALVSWLAFQLIDLLTATYMNSELLRPHRSLSDMIVPVTMRLLKASVALVVMLFMIYHFGQGDLLNRFLTGLGVAGLAASLAAQDILKSFFGTLLLIGERSFKLGDRIKVEGKEGVVEQVGFRSTRLRTLDGSLITIPNSVITSASIDNQGFSATRYYRAIVLGKELPVEEAASMRDRVEIWLQANSKAKPETIEVGIGLDREKGLEMQVQLMLKEGPAMEEARARQEIDFGVLRIIQAREPRRISAAAA